MNMEMTNNINMQQLASQQLSQEYYAIAPQVAILEKAADDQTGASFFDNLWRSITDPNQKTTVWVGGESGVGKGTVIGQLIQLIEQAKGSAQEGLLPVEIPENLQIQTTSLGQAIYYAHHVLQPGETNHIASEPGQYTKDDYLAASKIIADWRREFFAQHPDEPCLFFAEGPVFTHPQLDQTWSALSDAVKDQTENHTTFLLALVSDKNVLERTRRIRSAATDQTQLQKEAQQQHVQFDERPEDLAIWRVTRGSPGAIENVGRLIDQNVINNLSDIRAYTTNEGLIAAIDHGLHIEQLRQDEALRQAAVTAYYEWLAYDTSQLDMALGQVLVAPNTLFRIEHQPAEYEPITHVPYYEGVIQRHAHPYRRRNHQFQ